MDNRKLRLVSSGVGASVEDRLLANIARLDDLKREIAGVEADIGRDARIYANGQGLTLRPRIEQLRRMLMVGG